MMAGEIRRPFWDNSTCSGPSARPSGSSKRDLFARMKVDADVDDQAQPAAAMVDDQHAVIVAERARRS